MVRRSFILSLALVSLTTVPAARAAASFIIAYDDAADSAYNSGWANGSNGGYGFGAWSHSALGMFAMGDSNANGTLGGPGINVGGRAWQAELNPGWTGAAAVRSLGTFGVGDSLEVDVDFGIAPTPGHGVAIFGSSDYCQVQAIGSSSGNLLINTSATTVVTSIPYSDGGYRVTFDLLSATSANVTIFSMASSAAQTLTLAYVSGSGTQMMSLQTTNPSAGQAVYASRMKITSPVPEPASMLALGFGLASLLRRRTARS
ncbi:MAG: PEP-CTERM sorting domain-containing protein [Chthonomonas sp.]|nr:PEP-CTERM sorting domain-containing protein [Chthonomonas sp.]